MVEGKNSDKLEDDIPAQRRAALLHSKGSSRKKQEGKLGTLFREHEYQSLLSMGTEKPLEAFTVQKYEEVRYKLYIYSY